ncbi:MAG: alkaline phosphatase family protein [Solobacterium sp.]|nr:alkaline phosphatase family protein [Solobacterium sp.]
MNKLFVFMIDALCSSDIELMKTLPHFKQVIEEGSYVEHLYPVHPALTYCCHTSIVTGKYVDGHGITNNEFLKRGVGSSDVWFGKKEEVKAPTLLDYAREAGLTTCSLSWPVSAGADYTYNMPMIVPYHYHGDHPEEYLYGNATDNLMDAYFWKYGRYLKGANHNLDAYTMAIAPDLIRDFGQPDVMFVKMCDLDTMRHHYGVHHEMVDEQLQKHDEEFGVLVESLKRYGDYEHTNFVIMGDHGQTDIEDVLNMNKVLQLAGFMKTDEEGKIISYDAYAHSAGLTCFIELANPNDAKMEQRVKEFLEGLKEDTEIQLAYVLDKKEMKETYHLEGPFDFVIESKRNISFDFRENMQMKGIFRSKEPGDHIIGAATHGGSPHRAEHTLFLACGPSIKQGVILKEADMVDEAVTMAAMTGFAMPNTDGKILKDILK